MLDKLIDDLKDRLFQEINLDILAYYFINNKQDEIIKLNVSEFTGEIEEIAVKSFSEEFANPDDIKKIVRKLSNEQYKKHITICGLIALYLQDILQDTKYFEPQIQEWFEKHSFRQKFLLAKIFTKLFSERFKKSLQTQVDSEDMIIKVLKYIYLDIEINKNQSINYFKNIEDDLDMIDLLILEEFQNIKSIGYSKIQEELFDDIIYCSNEIQSKHRVLNNNEDQYNSIFQSLLEATKKYKTEAQTQRGESYTKTQYGELDIAIFTKDNLLLSIFEAFVIKSIEKDYITIHLKKLSENYDANGLKSNYAVIYAKSVNFFDLWQRYKDIIPTINFEHRLISSHVEDLTSRFSHFTGIKIGLTKHQNRGLTVQIYHIFMDMNFSP